MSLLDELKKQAEEKQRLAAEQAREAARQQTGRLELLEPLFDQIEAWLKTFTQTLNQIGSDELVDYDIPRLGVMPELQQGNYNVTRGQHDVLPPVHLMFSLYNDQSVNFDIDNETRAEHIIQELKTAGLAIHSVRKVRKSDGKQHVMLTLKGNIPVRIDFIADEKFESVIIRIRNFESPGVVVHHVKPEQINESFLESLGHYLLRQSRGFLRDNVSLEIRQQLREKLEREAREKESSESKGVGHSLRNQFKKLFDRTPKLQLTYQGKDYVIEASGSPFIVGRGRDCQLKVMAQHVSRHHFMIMNQGSNFVLEDMSRNGTFIKPYDGREVMIKQERIGLRGKGFMCPGAPASEDQEHLIYYEVIGPGEGL
jgi:hypothetical protein